MRHWDRPSDISLLDSRLIHMYSEAARQNFGHQHQTKRKINRINLYLERYVYMSCICLEVNASYIL